MKSASVSIDIIITAFVRNKNEFEEITHQLDICKYIHFTYACVCMNEWMNTCVHVYKVKEKESKRNNKTEKLVHKLFNYII